VLFVFVVGLLPGEALGVFGGTREGDVVFCDDFCVGESGEVFEALLRLVLFVFLGVDGLHAILKASFEALAEAFGEEFVWVHGVNISMLGGDGQKDAPEGAWVFSRFFATWARFARNCSGSWSGLLRLDDKSL